MPNCTNIPFTQSYTSSPICTCSDTATSSPATCDVNVTLGPPTTLTIGGATGHTYNYICIGQN